MFNCWHCLTACYSLSKSGDSALFLVINVELSECPWTNRPDWLRIGLDLKPLRGCSRPSEASLVRHSVEPSWLWELWCITAHICSPEWFKCKLLAGSLKDGLLIVGSYNPCCNSRPLSLLEQKQVGAGLGFALGGDFGFYSSFVEKAQVAVIFSRAFCVLKMTWNAALDFNITGVQ